MLRNIKLIIAYDGTEYHGWQIQPGFDTIQGIISEILESLIGKKTSICGASRTDAGVSALGQIGLIQIDSPIPTENLARAITDRLPDNIAVIKAEEVPMGFDVIGAVKSKLYRYTIFNGSVRPVLHIKRCWHIPGKLDISAIKKAAPLFVGKKDFKSFASADDSRLDSVRTIFKCDVINQKDNTGQWIYIDVQGNGFLYNMVRNIVGTLVDIGFGRWKPEKVAEIIEAKDRTKAGQLAPASGLCLMWIQY